VDNVVTAVQIDPSTGYHPSSGAAASDFNVKSAAPMPIVNASFEGQPPQSPPAYSA
jgi:hypothetical protein